MRMRPAVLEEFRRPLAHELTLDEVNRGFDLMEAQDGIRSVIRFG
jgi:Zn-dependent alcohol dehydrogenase